MPHPSIPSLSSGLRLPWTKLAWRMGWMALGSWIVMKLSLAWLINPQLSWIFPLNGLALGTALVSQRRLHVPPWSVFVSVYVAALAARLHGGMDLSYSVGWTMLNVLEAVGAWFFLRKDFSHNTPITMNALGRLFSYGVLFFPGLSTVAYCWMHSMHGVLNFWEWVLPFWAKGASSIAIFTSCILLWTPQAVERFKKPGYPMRFIFATLLHFAVLMLIFTQSKYPYLFFFAPSLMFLVVRARMIGAAVGMFLAAIVAYLATYMGTGPMQLIQGDTLADTYLHQAMVLHLYLFAVASVAVSGSIIFEDNSRLFKALKQNEQAMADLAGKDPLTGLLNRRGLDRALQTLFDSQKPFTAILMDVDYFKRYNDTYGHGAGDNCLIWLAQQIQQEVDHQNVITARLGGEEFLAILPCWNEQEGLSWAQELHQRIRDENYTHESSPFKKLTLSMGLSQHVDGEKTLTAVLRRADQALYQAKENGRNQIEVDQEAPMASQSC